MRASARVTELVDEMLEDPARFGTTYAAVVVQHDEILVERYGGAIPHWDGPDEPVTPDTRLLSWSMAKSVLHAAVGILVGRGLLVLDAPARVARWSAPDDPRGAITLEQLLTMRDGLAFSEDYVDAGVSNVIEMLFGAGRDDVAGYAASRPLAHPPGEVFNYSSGTSNIVARVVGDIVGGGEPEYGEFLRAELFEPVGMHSATPRFDASGTWIGSSYLYATARDFVRFGLLYLHDGVCAGRRILPDGWVAHGVAPRSVDPDGGEAYGAHWWIVGDAHGSFRASGYEGQSLLVVPALDLVVARLGRSTQDQRPALADWRAAVTDACAEG